MYEVSPKHLQALKNGTEVHFHKVGNSWYALIDGEGHFSLLNKIEGYLVDFWIIKGLVAESLNSKDYFTATNALLSMELEEGFVFKF